MNKIDELLSGNPWNKKEMEQHLQDVLSNTCFEILNPYFIFAYSSNFRPVKTLELTNAVFYKIDNTIKALNKSMTFEEFKDVLMGPVYYSKETIERLKAGIPSLEDSQTSEETINKLEVSLEEIFDKFFTKKKQVRRKYVRAKKQRD